jgi:hypothetical protein
MHQMILLSFAIIIELNHLDLNHLIGIFNNLCQTRMKQSALKKLTHLVFHSLLRHMNLIQTDTLNSGLMLALPFLLCYC